MAPTVLAFGESMIRYAPTNLADEGRGQPSARATYLRSVGGDELNVLVALANFSYETEYVSLLPEGPLGDVVYNCGTDSKVSMKHVKRIPYPSEVGTYTVIPKEKRVHYQRSNSAFAKQTEGEFNWSSILGSSKPTWIHATGITPSLGAAARANWQQQLVTAKDLDIPVSIDLNWRPALCTLEDLWSVVLEVVRFPNVKLLIFSVQSLEGVFKIMQKATGGSTSTEGYTPTDLLRTLREAVFPEGGVPVFACCFKTRNEDGVQTRWSSAVAGQDDWTTTKETPVIHSPKDECGGGSAWAAGIIDFFINHPEAHTNTHTPSLCRALRHGDALAALCQESQGDHSTVTRGQFDPYLDLIIAGEPIDLTSPFRHNPVVEENISRLSEAGVVAIIRAKNTQAAINRGVELAEMGCKALEVTVDSVGFEEILPALVERIGHKCLVGVGTVMDAETIPKIAKLGAKFALSPINPPGMTKACLDANVVPVPAACSPQEIYDAYKQGAQCVKLFPAQLYNPDVLKAMLAVGELGQIKIIPSGGITPNDAPLWLQAGAFAVGMGSKLVGSDVRAAPNTEAYENARAQWEASGKTTATHFLRWIEGYQKNNVL